MDIHDSLCEEHRTLRSLIDRIRTLRQSSPTTDLQSTLETLKALLRRHFASEEIYYRTVDQDKRFEDRGFIHQLRNDHAALLFGMESLLIRFRKYGPVLEWWQHFEKLMDVFLPHMDGEEKTLFPAAERLLTAAEWATIREGIQRLSPQP